MNFFMEINVMLIKHYCGHDHSNTLESQYEMGFGQEIRTADPYLTIE